MLLPRNLIRFILIRVLYNSAGTDKNPYVRKGGGRPSRIAVGLGAGYLVLQIAALNVLASHGDALLLAVVPAGLWAAITAYYLLLPAAQYHQSRVHPVIPARLATVLRLSHATAVFAALAWTRWATGAWASAYYFCYWLVPIFTSFAFFMILRQTVQHGNGGRGLAGPTRACSCCGRSSASASSPFARTTTCRTTCFATVPHYRLRQAARTIAGVHGVPRAGGGGGRLFPAAA